MIKAILVQVLIVGAGLYLVGLWEDYREYKKEQKKNKKKTKKN